MAASRKNSHESSWQRFAACLECRVHTDATTRKGVTFCNGACVSMYMWCECSLNCTTHPHSLRETLTPSLLPTHQLRAVSPPLRLPPSPAVPLARQVVLLRLPPSPAVYPTHLVPLAVLTDPCPSVSGTRLRFFGTWRESGMRGR